MSVSSLIFIYHLRLPTIHKLKSTSIIRPKNYLIRIQIIPLLIYWHWLYFFVSFLNVFYLFLHIYKYCYVLITFVVTTQWLFPRIFIKRSHNFAYGIPLLVRYQLFGILLLDQFFDNSDSLRILSGMRCLIISSFLGASLPRNHSWAQNTFFRRSLFK